MKVYVLLEENYYQDEGHEIFCGVFPSVEKACESLTSDYADEGEEYGVDYTPMVAWTAPVYKYVTNGPREETEYCVLACEV